jgi:hypothetical protein
MKIIKQKSKKAKKQEINKVIKQESNEAPKNRYAHSEQARKQEVI